MQDDGQSAASTAGCPFVTCVTDFYNRIRYHGVGNVRGTLTDFHVRRMTMKKNLMAALLLGTVVAISVTGCGEKSKKTYTDKEMETISEDELNEALEAMDEEPEMEDEAETSAVAFDADAFGLQEIDPYEVDGVFEMFGLDKNFPKVRQYENGPDIVFQYHAYPYEKNTETGETKEGIRYRSLICFNADNEELVHYTAEQFPVFVGDYSEHVYITEDNKKINVSDADKRYIITISDLYPIHIEGEITEVQEDEFTVLSEGKYYAFDHLSWQTEVKGQEDVYENFVEFSREPEVGDRVAIDYCIEGDISGTGIPKELGDETGGAMAPRLEYENGVIRSITFQ